ncbi:MAG: amino acid adenylation domain-containing protein [Lachnospiraceae bacterium]|nr:amino acid adenylation domain-containing protein [Lachnospiraceae bacterium]
MRTRKDQGGYTLNLSQREIMMSEETFTASPVNVISVKLYSKIATAEEMKQACDHVLQQADIFSVRLIKGEEGYVFLPEDQGVRKSRICEKIWEKQEAREYIEKQDEVPIDPLEKLYEAEVLPLFQGGVILYVRFHHVIIDGYGMSLFAQRVVDKLEGCEKEPSIFFADRKSHSLEEGEKESEDFWRGYLGESETESTVFPEKVKGYDKNVMRYEIPGNLQKAALEMAEKAGVTLPYVYGGAYAIYLGGAVSRKKAVFLMPRLGRSSEEMDTLGCYTLLVPVAVSLSPEDRFQDVCQKLAESARQASAHKEIGYDAILRILREEHSISTVPSEYVFNWYRRELRSDTGCQAEFSVAGAMHNHLSLNLFQKKEEVYGVLDLRQGIYSEERGKFFIDSISRILSLGCENKKIKEIPIVGEVESQKLAQITGPQYSIDETATIPSMFRQAAREFSDRMAVYAGEARYTFAELDQLTDRIASGLVKRGVRPGDRVAFMLKRDFRLIPTLLGISKSGAAFLPVDPLYPEDRVKYILEDSQAAFLVSSPEVKGADQYDYVNVEELIHSPAGELPQIHQEDLAYMIYTSGTTGWPKGVMLSHRGIVNIVHPDNNPFNQDAVKNGHGIVAIGSICFDISLFEIFVPLLNGMFVELGDETAMLDARVLARYIEKHGADLLHCTPSRIAEYLEHPEFQEAMKKIRMILSAGEVLPSELARRLKEEYGIRIYNGYGPTETTIGATITQAGDTESIGTPIGNTGIWLLNEDGRQVPFGAMGEICVYGKGVGMGYHNKPEETSRKFLEMESRRVYRTGDLGHFQTDGRLIYHGRCDRQVKLRGLRIELSEIESAMTGYPGIRQAACIVKREKRSEYLAGFFTVQDGKEQVSSELQAYMKSRLTAYMVPDVFVQLETMPQTPGGKLDTKALESMEITWERHYVAPNTELEEKICQVFEQVLKQDQVGIQDNFFDLGGDSLMVMELILEMERKIGSQADLELEVQDIYTYPTPEQIAKELMGARQDKKGYPIQKLNYEGVQELLRQEIPLKTRRPKVILLTGVTGYLGIHILMELLQNPESFEKVICLTRRKGKLTPEKRVKNALFYYGENDFADSYGEKWFVAEGDITREGLTEEIIEEDIDLIVNAAANVAHVAYGDLLEKVNIGGTRNLISFALKNKAELVQISTISVSGVHRTKQILPVFTEQDLFAGQEIHSQYIYSKYMAEYEMIREALDQGLQFKIMRVGNLQGRSKDGEFQMNMKSNHFTRQLSSYVKMGIVPESVYRSGVNFSPVDEVAHMIAVLLQVENPQGIYHVYPEEEVEFARIFAALGRQGYEVQLLSDAEFEKIFAAAKADAKRKEQVEGLLMERPDHRYKDTAMSQKQTQNVLEALGEQWLPATEEYLEKYVGALDTLDMF